MCSSDLGRLSYPTPDRIKPITARKLGEDFDKAAVLALLTQNAHRVAEQTTDIPEYPAAVKKPSQGEKTTKTTPADNTLQRMATMMGKEWGGMGQNYLRSLLALAFQGFLIIICIAIYAVLVQNMLIDDNISTAIWLCMGYTVLLCFTLFKTSSLAKSIFNSH